MITIYLLHNSVSYYMKQKLAHNVKPDKMHMADKRTYKWPTY